MKYLPYRADTATGDSFDINFPLHEDTGSAVRVAQLVSVVLEILDKDTVRWAITIVASVMLASLISGWRFN